MTKYQQLEKTDRLIVDLLRGDGRMAYREIARRLSVSEGMVRKCVKRLLDAGWLRILAVTDPLELGVPVLATTYAKVSPRHLERVTDRLAGCDTIRYVATCVGSHNLVVESLHRSNAELHAFIQGKLGLEGIISSETIQVVKIKKSVWDWPVQVPTAQDDMHEAVLATKLATGGEPA